MKSKKLVKKVFFGREEELSSLQLLKSKDSASIVVINGRRRIGKSTLVDKFGESYKKYLNFQGLAPRKGITEKEQLRSFSTQFSLQTGIKNQDFTSWHQALARLAEVSSKGEVLILIDEISWFANLSPDLAGTIKIIWDTMFSKNNKLILVLCGSVAAWIDDNILNDADFVGRISLVIRLRELSLKDSAKLIQGNFSKNEKLSLLCIVGGIPKYLREINKSLSVVENIRRLCFSKGGYLFEDFERIFSDIFGKRSDIYKKLLKLIVTNPMSPSKISAILNRLQGGDLTEYFKDLELSGFISRDFSFKIPSAKSSRNYTIRISDNYLRFYLKYLEPNKARIQKGIFSFQSLQSLIAWETICGLQFENLIVNRSDEIIKLLKLEYEEILSIGPYRQTKTNRTKPIQVDLLIHCKPSTVFVCEIKFRKLIRHSIINEVKEKCRDLKFPKQVSKRQVLIFAGEIEQSVLDEGYFDKIINIEEFI